MDIVEVIEKEVHEDGSADFQIECDAESKHMFMKAGIDKLIEDMPEVPLLDNEYNDEDLTVRLSSRQAQFLTQVGAIEIIMRGIKADSMMD